MQLKKGYEDSIIPYILVFLATLNFFKFGSIIWLIYIVYSYITHLAYKKGLGVLQGNIFITFIISFFAAISAYYFEGVSSAIKALFIFLSCVVGYLNYNSSTDKSKFIKRICATLFAAYSTQIILLYLMNLNIDRGPYRKLYSIWGDEGISVTIVALLCTFIIAYSFYTILCNPKIISKIISVIALLFVILLNFDTATRTPFIVMFIAIVITVLFIPMKDDKIRIRIFGIIILGVLLFIALWLTNAFNVRTIILESSLFARMEEEGLESLRFEISKKHLAAMFDYLLGGSNISADVGHMAHNILQETHDLFGLIPAVGMLFLVIDFFIKGVKLLRFENKDNTIKLLFFIYVCVFFQLFTEPILKGYPLFIWSFILINSLTTAYLKDKSKKEECNVKYC